MINRAVYEPLALRAVAIHEFADFIIRDFTQQAWVITLIVRFLRKHSFLRKISINPKNSIFASINSLYPDEFLPDVAIEYNDQNWQNIPSH
jgi:hypothetical protein